MTQLPDFMYDAIHAENIPAGAKYVAGYVNGRWPSYYGYDFQRADGSWAHSPSVHQQCPGAVAFAIAVSADADGDILDVEKFDATPEEAPGWAVRQRARGRPNATIYCDTSTWPAVKAAFSAQRVPLAPWWGANYSWGPHLYPGSDALQFGGVNNLYDTSVVDSGWPLLAERIGTVSDFTPLDRSMLTQIFGVIEKIPKIFLQNEQTQAMIQQYAAQVASGGGVPSSLVVTLSGTATSAKPG